MKSQRRIVFGILLTALLALCFGALADSPLGIRSGAPYGSISLSSGTDAATVLDWLEDYLQSEITPNVMLASDLADYSEKVEQNRAMLNSANDDDVTKWLHDYDGVPNGCTLTARVTPEATPGAPVRREDPELERCRLYELGGGRTWDEYQHRFW